MLSFKLFLHRKFLNRKFVAFLMPLFLWAALGACSRYEPGRGATRPAGSEGGQTSNSSSSENSLTEDEWVEKFFENGTVSHEANQRIEVLTQIYFAYKNEPQKGLAILERIGASIEDQQFLYLPSENPLRFQGNLYNEQLPELSESSAPERSAEVYSHWVSVKTLLASEISASIVLESDSYKSKMSQLISDRLHNDWDLSGFHRSADKAVTYYDHKNLLAGYRADESTLFSMPSIVLKKIEILEKGEDLMRGRILVELSPMAKALQEAFKVRYSHDPLNAALWKDAPIEELSLVVGVDSLRSDSDTEIKNKRAVCLPQGDGKTYGCVFRMRSSGEDLSSLNKLHFETVLAVNGVFRELLFKGDPFARSMQRYSWRYDFDKSIVIR